MGRKQFDGKDYKITIQKLETAWALGCSDAEAAYFAGISKAALSDFLKRNPKISERKEMLLEKPVLNARNTLHKAINEGNAELAFKYLERKRPDEFAIKQKLELSGELDVSNEDLSDDINEINKSIDREIEEIKKIQESISKKHSHY
jgi:hypothetical protein